MRLRSSRLGPFYGCERYPACKGTHGAHPDGRPLGTPADEATRKARIAVHTAFDRLWTTGELSRAGAYAWMQRALGMSRDEAHIGKFSIAQCEVLLAALGNRVAADEPTIAARVALRAALADRFGEGKGARRTGRAWLGRALGLSGEGHVNDFDHDTCVRAIRLLIAEMESLDPPPESQ
jgi:hypothetical protein